MKKNRKNRAYSPESDFHKIYMASRTLMEDSELDIELNRMELNDLQKQRDEISQRMKNLIEKNKFLERRRVYCRDISLSFMDNLADLNEKAGEK